LESTSTAVRVPLVSMTVLVSEQWNVSGRMFCILVPLIFPSGSSMLAWAICEAKGFEVRLGVSRKIISSFFANAEVEQWLLMLHSERSAAELWIHLDWLPRPFWFNSKTFVCLKQRRYLLQYKGGLQTRKLGQAPITIVPSRPVLSHLPA